MQIDFEDEENTYEDPEDYYEKIGKLFLSSYSGRCTIDNTHIVKKNSWVTKVQRADNPMLTVTGVACSGCAKILRRGTR